MNLRELEYLVAVGDLGHFGRAAEVCHVSQPTLSTQLRKLEAELGVSLIERTPRRATLTPVGRLIAERARGALHEVGDIAELARAARDPSSGTLRVGPKASLNLIAMSRVTSTCCFWSCPTGTTSES